MKYFRWVHLFFGLFSILLVLLKIYVSKKIDVFFYMDIIGMTNLWHFHWMNREIKREKALNVQAR